MTKSMRALLMGAALSGFVAGTTASAMAQNTGGDKAADSGKKVWSIQTGSAIESIPVTYTVKGEQYVLTPVGWGSGSRLFAPAWTMATPQSKRGPSRLLAFKLGATTPFPTPPDVVRNAAWALEVGYRRIGVKDPSFLVAMNAAPVGSRA